jgi:ATP-binding cassette subfamily C protein
VWRVLGWSVPEAVPAAVSGYTVSRAVDAGFLTGRTWVGLGWLALLLAAAAVGAFGSRQVYLRLADLVEPFRDRLVERVVTTALHTTTTSTSTTSAAGSGSDADIGSGGDAGWGGDGGVLSRLTRQVEIVRDTYAGLLVVVRGFLVTVVAVVAGLLALDPLIAVLVLPPFLLAVAGFTATLATAAARQRASVTADERLAGAAAAVFTGLRDITAAGTEPHAAALITRPVHDQAAADRAVARTALIRTGCYAIGGWLPLALLLTAGGWLIDHGLTAGEIIGGLTYLLIGLRPALPTLLTGVGGSGLR